MKRGADYEREFCEYALKHGFHAERVAGSGARKKSACDVVLIKGGKAYLVEVKSVGESPFYLSKKSEIKEGLEKLRELAKRVGAIPLLAVRFKGKKRWVVRRVERGLSRIDCSDESLF